MPRVPLIFVDPVLAFSLHPDRAAALLLAFGVELPIDPRTAPARDFARAVWGLRADARFAEAVDVLGLLACDVGCAAIVTAAREEKRRLPRGLSSADLAAVLLTRRAGDASWEPVLEEALLQFARLVPDDLAFERVGREERACADPAGCAGAVRAALGDRFVDAWHGVDDDGVIHVAVLRREETRTAVVARPAGATRVVRRDIACDVVRIDVPEARFIARTSDPARVPAYAAAFGRALYGDAAFFGDAPAFTSRPLSQLGSAKLAKLQSPGVTRVRAVDLVWDDGKGTTHAAHGSDALAAYEERGGASGGYILSAMLRIDSPGSARPTDVAIQLPNRAAFREPRHERLARAALHAIGLDAPGTSPDDAFTLAPFLHAEWRWRRVLGDTVFERLRDRGLLVAAKGARMIAGRPEEKLGWSYVSFDLRSRPGTRYAVARDPSMPSRLVRDDERAMWALDLAAVARAHATDLRVESQEASRARERIAEGVIDLGAVRGRGVDLRVWSVLRAPATPTEARAWLESIQRASKGAHPVILLPEGRTIGGAVEIALTTAELFGASTVAAKVLAGAAEKLGIDDLVEPWRLAAPGVRFVGDAKGGRCWLDQIELVHVSTAGGKMLLTLAKADGVIVSTKAIESAMSPKRSSHGAASETAAKLGAWITRSFDDAGVTAPADAGEIVEVVGNKGWRMKVRAEVK